MTAGLGLALALSWAPGDGAAWQAGGEPPPPPRPDAQSPLGRVVARHRGGILTLPGVVGIAPGDCAGTPCVEVFVEADTPELRQRIPPQLDGYPVRLTVGPPVRALPTDPQPADAPAGGPESPRPAGSEPARGAGAFTAEAGPARAAPGFNTDAGPARAAPGSTTDAGADRGALTSAEAEPARGALTSTAESEPARAVPGSTAQAEPSLRPKAVAAPSVEGEPDRRAFGYWALALLLVAAAVVWASRARRGRG